MAGDVKSEARSLLEWLGGWGDGPNWSDASGATVPVVKESLRRVLEHVVSDSKCMPAGRGGSGRCTHCDVAKGDEMPDLTERVAELEARNAELRGLLTALLRVRAKGVKPMTIAVNERALVPTSDEERAKRFLEPILADDGSCGDELVEVLADQFAEVRRQTEDRVDVATLRDLLSEARIRLDQHLGMCACPGMPCVTACPECNTTQDLVNRIRAFMQGRTT